jgi:hypothetical protein
MRANRKNHKHPQDSSQHRNTALPLEGLQRSPQGENRDEPSCSVSSCGYLSCVTSEDVFRDSRVVAVVYRIASMKCLIPRSRPDGEDNRVIQLRQTRARFVLVPDLTPISQLPFLTSKPNLKRQISSLRIAHQIMQILTSDQRSTNSKPRPISHNPLSKRSRYPHPPKARCVSGGKKPPFQRKSASRRERISFSICVVSSVLRKFRMITPLASFNALTSESVDTIAASKDRTLGSGEEELLSVLSEKICRGEEVALGAVVPVSCSAVLGVYLEISERERKGKRFLVLSIRFRESRLSQRESMY